MTVCRKAKEAKRGFVGRNSPVSTDIRRGCMEEIRRQRALQGENGRSYRSCQQARVNANFACCRLVADVRIRSRKNNCIKFPRNFGRSIFLFTFACAKRSEQRDLSQERSVSGSLQTGITLTDGAIAQLVEQRTENPCVGGSIPPGTTKKINHLQQCRWFFYCLFP